MYFVYLQVYMLQNATKCSNMVFFGRVYGFHAGKPLKYACLFVLLAVCSFSALENKLNAIRFFR